MSLATPTIQKFFRENFTEAHPLQINPAERERVVAEIKTRLKNLTHISTQDRYYYSSHHSRERFLLEFSLKEASPQRRRGFRAETCFRLELDEQNRVLIEHYGAKAMISDWDELLNFVSACQERVERKYAQELKRKKVRDFKARAVLAQVQQLAQDEQFEFSLETDTRKMKLFVKLHEKECIELHVPFHKFQEILPELRSTILSLRELHAKGIKFKILGVQAFKYRLTWMKPDVLGEVGSLDHWFDKY